MKDKYLREVVITKNGVRRILRPIPQQTKTLKQRKTASQTPVKEKAKNEAQCLFAECNRRFNIAVAIANRHPHFCSKNCMSGISRKRRTRDPYAKKRAEKQQRRRRKQAEAESVQSTPEIVGFYASAEWRDLRFHILRKFNWTCLSCGRSRKNHGVVLHVDHIKPRSKYPKLELDPENLQVLCEDCNLGKSNKSEDDLRPVSK